MRRWPVLLAALLFLLSGCAPQARELDGMALVRVLGVDGGERSPSPPCAAARIRGM